MLQYFLNIPGSVLVMSLLISFAVAIFHYEVLGYLTVKISHIKKVTRLHVLIAMLGITLTHIISILIYALIYYIMIHYLKIGHLNGMDISSFEDYVYYSVIVYTSLGFGDVTPVGGIRVMSGLETLNGLILVAWTASYSYLIMSKYWVFKNPEIEVKFNK